jgi:hypothetical protein
VEVRVASRGWAAVVMTVVRGGGGGLAWREVGSGFIACCWRGLRCR